MARFQNTRHPAPVKCPLCLQLVAVYNRRFAVHNLPGAGIKGPLCKASAKKVKDIR